MGHQKQPPLDIALSRLARRQHGLVAVWQLPGLSGNAAAVRIRTGRLHRLHRGVYAVGHDSLTQEGRWLAAVLACGPGAALSHASATALWQLRPRRSGPADVTVARRGRRSPSGIRVHSVRALEERMTLNAIPVTTVERTLLDYAETARPQELRLAIEQADRLDRFDLTALNELIERSPGRRGVRPLRAVLAAMHGHATPDTRSELENRMLAFCRAHGIPEPLTNVLVHGELVDCYWPAARLVVELDSWRFHKSRAEFERDRRRDAKLTARGERVIRLTDRRLAGEPAVVAAEIRQAAQTDLL